MVKNVKLNLADHRIEDVKFEENQVSYLKREYQKLMTERETLVKKRGEKEEALEYYKPLDQQVSSTAEKYKKTKSENAELKKKILEKEREINRYHKIKQLAKNAVKREVENPNYEMMKMDNEIMSMRKEMRRIEEKWKSKLGVFDVQYFGFKSIVTDKEQNIETLEREAKNWEYKSGHYRN